MSLQFIRTFLIFTLVVTSSLASAVEYEYKLLKDIRSEISLPAISIPERHLVLNQIQFVYDELFIHQEVKLRDFGISANPTAYINNMKQRVETLSDNEFYQQVVKAYDGLRDLHSGVVLPKPYSCYRSVLPFSFKEVLDEKGSSIIAVEKLASVEFTQQVEEILPVKIGDVLLNYNNIKAHEYLNEMIRKSLGANSDAQRRYSLLGFSTKSHAYSFLPKEDSVRLKLRNQRGHEYDLEVSWIVRKNIDCLKKSSYDQIGASRENLNEIFPEAQNVSEEWESTEEPTLKFKKIRNSYGSFGVIKIESFRSTVLGPNAVIQSIQKLLENDFASFNDGLIFDIRDNFGGYIKVAENIVQLFSPERISPFIFRLKVSPANNFYWNTDPYFILSHYREALNSASTGRVNYVDLPLNVSDDTHSLGQVYFKPVAIFNNALCYSACDMFSAKVQDFGAAIVFGEDSTTGAGGANSWSYSDFFSQLPLNEKGPFIKLPNEMDIDLSYRQTVRTGIHSGELIENVGVLSDKIIKPTLDDLRNGSTRQYEVISKHLAEQSADYRSSVTILNSGVSVIQDEKISISAIWTNTNSMEYLVEGKIIGTAKTDNDSFEWSTIPLSNSINTTAIGDFSVEIIGRNNGRKVWRKVFKYYVRPRI